MTKLDKPVKRESYSSVRERGSSRPLVVELHPTFMRLRLKGRRHFVVVAYDAVYSLGAKLLAAETRRDKVAERVRRKKERI